MTKSMELTMVETPDSDYKIEAFDLALASSRYNILWDMLSHGRPAYSSAEKAFIRKYITPLGVERDGVGNCIKRIGDSPVLWSCHTDTVHWRGGFQNIEYHEGFVSLAPNAMASCLGADCTAGVWLMTEMIKAEVPGLYIFHRGEEVGGVGSMHIANKTPELLKDIKCAIAFDRFGYDSIITHQMSRCCSDVFAKSLADTIGLNQKCDDGGTFTDTANYVDLIGECTNISVGYFGQHGKKERQDVDFLTSLLSSLLRFTPDNLVYERKPGEIDPTDWQFGYAAAPRWKKGSNGAWSKLDADEWGIPGSGVPGRPSCALVEDDGGFVPSIDTLEKTENLIAENPALCADIFREWGMDYAALAEDIYQRGGIVDLNEFTEQY